jgi:hypothetical protein
MLILLAVQSINDQGNSWPIIYDKSIAEILLLTDVSHVMPIISNNHFCNARGSGRPGVITCTYSKLIWPDPIEIGQEFFSSGMGGIYPSNILIGYVSSINTIDDANIHFDIDLVANPIKGEFYRSFGNLMSNIGNIKLLVIIFIANILESFLAPILIKVHINIPITFLIFSFTIYKIKI